MEQRKKKKKKSPAKKNTHIYIYISRIDTEIAIGVPRVIFFLFSNQIWESLRTLEHEEERYAIGWITDEKSCGKKEKKNSQINRWNSMPEWNSAYRDGIVPIRSFHRLRKYKIRIHQTFFHPFCHLFVIIISIKGGGGQGRKVVESNGCKIHGDIRLNTRRQIDSMDDNAWLIILMDRQASDSSRGYMFLADGRYRTVFEAVCNERKINTNDIISTRISKKL